MVTRHVEYPALLRAIPEICERFEFELAEDNRSLERELPNLRDRRSSAAEPGLTDVDAGAGMFACRANEDCTAHRGGRSAQGMLKGVIVGLSESVGNEISLIP